MLKSVRQLQQALPKLQRKSSKKSKKYFVYILECNDSSLYTGYTTDIEKRLIAHNSGTTGAKYTKARRPVVLKYSETYKTLSKALKREHALKKLSRQEKLLLLKNSNLKF